MKQKDQYIFLKGRFIKISGGKADVQIVTELPADPVEGTIYLLESDAEEILDITDGITEEIKESVRVRPERMLRYEGRLFSPVYKDYEDEIPNYYASVQADEELAFGFEVNWQDLEITEEWEIPLGGGEGGITVKDVQVNGESVITNKIANIILSKAGKTGEYDDLNNKPILKPVATSGSYNDLGDKPTIPAEQVNSDWNATSGKAQILNKPTIPAEQVNSDWNATSGKAQILNKPTIPTKVIDLSDGSDYLKKTETSADSNKLNGQNAAYYLNYSNFTNTPTNLGDFTNDVGFITKDANNLVYYYPKTNTYSKTEVQELIAGKQTAWVIDTQDQITGTKDSDENYTNVTAITGLDLSLVRVGDDIYIKDKDVPDYWISAKTENNILTLNKLLTKIDLTDYLTKTEANNLLNAKANLNGGNTFTGTQNFQGGASITTSGYVIGTWLQTTGNIALGGIPSLYAVINNGWIYSRTLAQTKEDLGITDKLDKSGGTMTGDLFYKKMGSNPSSGAINGGFYFFNSDSSVTSQYGFGLYQWGDVFQFTVRNNDGTSGGGWKSTAFEIDGSTGKTDFKVVPTVNGAAIATTSQIPTKTSQLTNDSKYAVLDNSSQAGDFYATNFFASSDKRLKKHIRKFKYDKSILDLNVYTYDFKKGSKNQIGCIAQELQELYPNLVVKNDEGFLSIQENKIVYLLLEEVKNLKKELDALKKKVGE